jgi:NTP pyrophosphatase (non-canonical NTP hydrolase)
LSPEEYIVKAMGTRNGSPLFFQSDTIHCDIVHAGLGLVTEAGEYADVLKKAMIYGKEPDLVNLDEEAGDMCWYLALHCFTRNISFSDLFEQNIAKLAKRFPDKFTEDQAINRDVVAERKVLEDTTITREYIRRHQRPPQVGDMTFQNGKAYDFTAEGWVPDQ